jgi:DNA-binding HxlR family transcriptional regulator
MAKTKLPKIRRSPCPVSCTLDIVGDKWTLLIVRDLLLGKTRFKEFAASPERIPTNLLAERLERLLARGLIIQCSPSDGTKHLAYQLTEKGKALHAVLAALRGWGLRWERGTRALLEASVK